jgi:hypothetical protein
MGTVRRATSTALHGSLPGLRDTRRLADHRRADRDAHRHCPTEERGE